MVAVAARPKHRWRLQVKISLIEFFGGPLDGAKRALDDGFVAYSVDVPVERKDGHVHWDAMRVHFAGGGYGPSLKWAEPQKYVVQRYVRAKSPAGMVHAGYLREDYLVSELRINGAIP